MADYEFPGWDQGVNNVFREDRLTRRHLRKGDNIDLLPGGHPRRRRGYEPVFQGDGFHSIASVGDYLVFVKGADLCVSQDLVNYETVFTGVTGELAKALVNEDLYFTDGEHTGVLTTQGTVVSMGTPSPEYQPTVSAIPDGGLYEGTYQVAVTFVGSTGVESGTYQAANVVVPEGGGIRLDNIPQPEPNALGIRIYVSEANGESLFHRTQVLVGTTSKDIGHLRARKKLATQFLDAMPPGDYLSLFNGRLFCMEGRLIIFSEPLNFGMYHTTQGFIPLASDGRGMAPSEDGLYVSDSKAVYYLRGNRPDDFTLSSVDSAPAQVGSMTTVDGGLFDAALAHVDVVAWWSASGYMIIGLPGGEVRRIREAELALPEYQKTSMAEVERDGVKQLLSLMKNPGMRSSTAFGDDASIEVHKKGITL